jgi:hypothetical protein
MPGNGRGPGGRRPAGAETGPVHRCGSQPNPPPDIRPEIHAIRGRPGQRNFGVLADVRPHDAEAAPESSLRRCRIPLMPASATAMAAARTEPPNSASPPTTYPTIIIHPATVRRADRSAGVQRCPALAQPPDRITRRRERAWRQPDVTGEHVTILATGKCVAARRRAVLRWARRGKIFPLYQEGGAHDVR